MKDKTTAAILALLLGGFGVHKFYLERTGEGIVYLLFFWTFIPALIAFFEFIGFLTMSEETFNQRYNSAARRPRDIAAAQPSSTQQLQELHQLHLAGALSREEFEAQKRRLLG